MMSCRLKVPAIMRVWRGLSARLSLRPSYRARAGAAPAAGGLGRLRKEVRTCDYSDVHIMWEMLSRPSSNGSNGAAVAVAAAARRARTGRRKPAVVVVAAAAAAWSRLAFYCCGL